MGAISIAALPLASSVSDLNLLAIVLGLTLGGFASLAQTHAVESVRPELAGAAVGFNALLITSGMMIGPALFAICLQIGGYRSAFSVVAFGLLVGAALFLFSARSLAEPQI